MESHAVSFIVAGNLGLDVRKQVEVPRFKCDAGQRDKWDVLCPCKFTISEGISIGTQHQPRNHREETVLHGNRALLRFY